MQPKVAVHLAEGFEEIEAVSIIDVLRRAEIETLVVSVTEKPEVTGSHGIKITADQLFEAVDYKTVEMIVLPGGMPGAQNLKNHNALGEQILQFNKSGKPLGAICAAPMVLGNLGILANQKATCFPGFEDQLTGAQVTAEDVVTSGKIVTGRGPGVAIKFALKIVETIKGKELADELGKKMIATR